MQGCLSCGMGFHWECHIEDECPCISAATPLPLSSSPVSSLRVGRPVLPDDEVKDPRSTMRKRAQKLLREHNVNIGDPCEWRGLANVGGGRHPIVGCRDGIVKHIHHGPDKNWYHNTRDNLHGICNYCHNRWHAKNDSCYDPLIPHNPRDATEEELVLWNDSNKIPFIDHKDCENADSDEDASNSGTSPV